jgi:hypothetical protein
MGAFAASVSHMNYPLMAAARETDWEEAALAPEKTKTVYRPVTSKYTEGHEALISSSSTDPQRMLVRAALRVAFHFRPENADGFPGHKYATKILEV